MRAIPVVLVGTATALWLLSAAYFLPTAYLPEISSWGRQFVLFSQFGWWAVIVGTLALTAEGFVFHHALGVKISWSLLLVFLSGLSSSVLALAARAHTPGLFEFLPEFPPAAYVSLIPGYIFTLILKSLFLLPIFFFKKPGASRYVSSVAKSCFYHYAVVLAGFIAADMPFYLGNR